MEEIQQSIKKKKTNYFVKIYSLEYIVWYIRGYMEENKQRKELEILAVQSILNK